jgi:4-carboxymuconolactone decarboxylase
MAKEKTAVKDGKPGFYKKASKKFPEVFNAVEHLGKTLRQAGPLDEKTTHLVQLAAAAAAQSEGAVRSHTRRALQAGAVPEEIHHALLLLVSTIGFPQAMAALSWAEESLKNRVDA